MTHCHSMVHTHWTICVLYTEWSPCMCACHVLYAMLTTQSCVHVHVQSLVILYSIVFLTPLLRLCLLLHVYSDLQRGLEWSNWWHLHWLHDRTAVPSPTHDHYGWGLLPPGWWRPQEWLQQVCLRWPRHIFWSYAWNLLKIVFIATTFKPLCVGIASGYKSRCLSLFWYANGTISLHNSNFWKAKLTIWVPEVSKQNKCQHIASIGHLPGKHFMSGGCACKHFMSGGCACTARYW